MLKLMSLTSVEHISLSNLQLLDNKSMAVGVYYEMDDKLFTTKVIVEALIEIVLGFEKPEEC
uniref:AlNc14C496G11928 protein n=1 Tax=Albugo laibachii Nc14 TaxID=890382 RepID=F0X0I4_9STRA|nr:AlNc14C496G11928 [Albugo laibachii Nc14]|eukprot:CCA27274.1 AlNc14C496G11928 [Albugo laibachii Nc14]